MLRKWLDIPEHIERFNDELGEVLQRLATVEADMRWVKWGVVTIAGGVIALIIKVFVGT